MFQNVIPVVYVNIVCIALYQFSKSQVFKINKNI